MVTKRDLQKLATVEIKDQYTKQLNRVRANKQQADKIADAVEEVIKNLPKALAGSLVVYGDPQSGKTEMMICLTARLLDEGHKIIIHLLNDSVDLLRQSLDRFTPGATGCLSASVVGSVGIPDMPAKHRTSKAGTALRRAGPFSRAANPAVDQRRVAGNAQRQWVASLSVCRRHKRPALKLSPGC